MDDYSMHLPINVKNYGSEEERLESFIGWPLNESVHPEKLARVGFVYTGEGSLVQYFQCGVRYRNWLKEMYLLVYIRNVTLVVPFFIR